jgi:hypothetical protein
VLICLVCRLTAGECGIGALHADVAGEIGLHVEPRPIRFVLMSRRPIRIFQSDAYTNRRTGSLFGCARGRMEACGLWISGEDERCLDSIRTRKATRGFAAGPVARSLPVFCLWALLCHTGELAFDFT